LAEGGIMARIGFGWRSGETLTYEALQADGTVRTAAGTSIPEIASTGYYTVVDGSVVTSDVAVISDATGEIGFGIEGPLASLVDNAITASKYDESTAFAVKSDDSGSTQIARTGADGDTLETISDEIAAAQTSLDDIPNTAEFEARTIVSAGYFDPAVDVVANVTLVDTTTTNTDVRGTDNAATEAKQDLMQIDVSAILVDTDATIPGLISGLNDFDPDNDTVAQVTLVDTTTVNTDMRGTDNANTTKTGYKLASDGLDSVSITEPGGVAGNFREMVVQTWRRLFKKSKMTPTTLISYKDDGTTAATTQTLSETDSEQNMGAAT
jgi:hypothetical protein